MPKNKSDDNSTNMLFGLLGRYHRTKRIKPNPSPTGTIGERWGSDLSQTAHRV